MVLTVNGERKDIASDNLTALLNELEYQGSHFAIAVNFEVVPRARWSETRLSSGDQIEILTPRQGG
jgi:sulfur carrier protein